MRKPLNKKDLHKPAVTATQAKKNKPASAAKPFASFDDYLPGNRAFYLLCFSLLCIGFYVFNDYLLFNKLYIFKDIGSDTYNQFYPSYVHLSDYFRNEGIPKWSFAFGMGQSMFGGIGDIFGALVYAIGAKNIPYVFVYVEFLKVFLAGIVFFFYFRTLSFTKFTSLIGGLLFAFSGYMIVGGGWYGHSEAMLCFGFLLFSFEKLYRENRWYYFPLAVILMSDASPFYLYSFSVFLFTYTLFRFFSDSGFDIKKLISLLIKMAGLGLLGILINCAFIITPMLQLINSPRVSGGVGYFNTLKAVPIFAFEHQQHYVTALMRLFSNDLLGTGSKFSGWNNYLEAPIFYCGMISILLFPLIFTSLNRKNKIIFSVFFLTWMSVIIFPYFRYAFFLFSGDYYKNGVSLFIPVVFLFFGMYALNTIDRTNKVNFLVLAANLVLLVILLEYPYSGNFRIDDSLRNSLAAFLVMYSILISLLSIKNAKVIAQAILLFLVCVELGYQSHITTNARDTMPLTELTQKTGFNDYSVDAVKFIKSIDREFYRVNKAYFSGTAIHGSLNDAQLQGYFGTPSYNSLNQLSYINFLTRLEVIKPKDETATRWSVGLVNRPALLTLASTKYTLTKQKLPGYFQVVYDSIAKLGDVTVLKNKHFLPLGFTYNTYIPARDFDKISPNGKDVELFKAFVAGEKDSGIFNDLKKMSLADTVKNYTFDEHFGDIARLKEDTLAITSFKQSHITGTIHTAERKLLFFTIPFDEGWIATVDGKESKLHLINIGFMGLIIEPGKHTIEIEYTIPYIRTGIIISLTGILIYLILIGLEIKKSIKKNSIKNQSL